MGSRLMRDSLSTRLVAGLLAGGLLLSVGIAAVEWSRGRELVMLEATQRSSMVLQNMRSVLRVELASGLGDAVEGGASPRVGKSLSAFTRSEMVSAIRLTGPSGAMGSWGAWPSEGGGGEAAGVARVWSVSENPVLAGDEVSLAGLTSARLTVLVEGRAYFLEVLIDGSAATGPVWWRVWEGVAWAWALIGAMLLAAVWMLRRWVERPMQDLTGLVSVDAGSRELERWASTQSGELATLAGAMGQMLERVETARATLDRRERRSESLFHEAPVAMLSVTGEGRVTHANARAGAMFGASGAAGLIGRGVDELVAEEDLPRLWATVERAGYRRGQRVELRLMSQSGEADAGREGSRWAVVEATPVTDSSGSLTELRLCFVDMTAAVRLREETERQARLLNLLIDHMSDAILLVDADGRVAAANQQMAGLLGRPAGSLLDSRYDAATMWEPLGLVDEEAFVSRLSRLEADVSRPVQARFETRSGAFMFRGVAVHGDEGEVLGRLWVVQETTSQEQGQRMLIEQNQRLAAMRRVATALSGVYTFDEVTQAAVSTMREELGVDTVGLAVRRGIEGQRCRQLIHRGESALGLNEYGGVLDFVQHKLMPRTMNGSHTLHWAELNGGTDYGRAFGGIGLTTAAACALTGSDEVVGVLWAGQRGGDGLERHQLLMLETMAPLIAARLEVADQLDRLEAMSLVDKDTRLLNREAVERMGSRSEEQGRPWALLRIDATAGGEDGEWRKDWPSLIAAVTRLTRRSSVLAQLEDGVLAVVIPGAGPRGASAAAKRIGEGLVDWVAASRHPLTLGWSASPSDAQGVEAMARAAERRAEPIGGHRAAA